jgi:hypothetical protein
MLTIVKKNDSYDAITYQLENEDNSTVDLTGASVNFVMGKKNKLITNAKATVTSATSGIVSYQLTQLDTLVSGTFLAEFVVTFANGTVKTYPSNGYITVDVEQNLDTSQANVVVDMIAEKQGDFTSKLNSILQQAGNINMSAMNEYSWTATEGQLIFIFPSSVNYTPSTKWFQVSVGNVPVDNTLVNRSYDNQFALNIDSSNIKAGMTVRAMWVEPITPVVPNSYKIIPQQDLPPVDAGEGDLWFDTSDNTYQGTVFDNLNSQLADSTSQISDLAINIGSYPRQGGETDDTGRFTRAIADLTAKKGGKIKLKGETYNLNSFSIPDNVYIEGQENKDPWNTDGTILNFIGTGTFITITSYHQRRAGLKNVNIVNPTSSRTNGKTAIRIKLNTNAWGGASDIEKVTIYGFQTGILHQMTYQSHINKCHIWECGTAISYNAQVIGSGQDITSSFGNVNLVENSNVVQCNVGIENATDSLNVYRNTDFEKCYVAIYTHTIPSFWKPQQNRYENCWFEANGWASPADKTANANPRYLICNSDMDASFNALGTNVAEIPQFSNCHDVSNVSPEIPSHNTNYQLYSILDNTDLRRFNSDDTILNNYKLPTYLVDRVTIGRNNAWRDIHTVGNHGVTSKINLNGAEFRTDTTQTGARTYTINYSNIVRPEASGSQNSFSSMALISIFARRTGFGTYNSIFLLSDMDEAANALCLKLGEDNAAAILSSNTITVSSAAFGDKVLTVNMTGTTDTVLIKINYLPNGLLRAAGPSFGYTSLT